VPDPDDGNIQMPVRRRRTRRHGRNRLIRRGLVAAVITVITVSLSVLALMRFSPSLFRARKSTASILERTRSPEVVSSEILSAAHPSRPVYPYSVVPGGVEDARELKWVAEHDPVVGAHYAGFDYDHARVVRLTLARTVYVSYRIGNRIYWSRHRVTLREGEKLITDGRITARSRCGNRVVETPQQLASPLEPPVYKFDEPVGAGSGTAMQSPPVAFESALLNRPETSGLGPAGPLTVYNPFSGDNWIPISPPPLPVSGLCGPLKKNGHGDDVGLELGGKKKKQSPCGSGGGGGGSGGATPEPGTWVFFVSGLAAICWLARRTLSRA
jgi:hypothetical protein